MINDIVQINIPMIIYEKMDIIIFNINSTLLKVIIFNIQFNTLVKNKKIENSNPNNQK